MAQNASFEMTEGEPVFFYGPLLTRLIITRRMERRGNFLQFIKVLDKSY
jgi:hypothetical protein